MVVPVLCNQNILSKKSRTVYHIFASVFLQVFRLSLDQLYAVYSAEDTFLGSFFGLHEAQTATSAEQRNNKDSVRNNFTQTGIDIGPMIFAREKEDIKFPGVFKVWFDKWIFEPDFASHLKAPKLRTTFREFEWL